MFWMAMFVSPSWRDCSLVSTSPRKSFASSCATVDFASSRRFCSAAISELRTSVLVCASLTYAASLVRIFSVSSVAMLTRLSRSSLAALRVSWRAMRSWISGKSSLKVSQTWRRYFSYLAVYISVLRTSSRSAVQASRSSLSFSISCCLVSFVIASSCSFFTARARFVSLSRRNLSNFATRSLSCSWRFASSNSFSWHCCMRCLYSTFFRSSCCCTSIMSFFFCSRRVDWEVSSPWVGDPKSWPKAVGSGCVTKA
mmetsp:Transcript_23265/g.68572  ORF Transcript_23265/g.68572 Transcript_23265/m.68572 type:complete len:255 (-) Transcript_23265:57-821(-)